MEAKSRRSAIEETVLSSHWLELLDRLNLGAYLVGPDRRIAGINKTARIIMGLTDVEAVGMECRGLTCCTPCHGQCPFHAGQCAPPDLPPETGYQIITGGHDKHLVTRVVMPLKDSGGRVSGCLTVLRDHSAISDLMDRIDYEEHRLKYILNNLELAVFTVNRGGYITFYNRAAEKLLGFPKKEMLGRDCGELFAHDARAHVEKLKTAVANNEEQRGQRGWMRTRSGETIPVSANYMALKNAKGAVVGGIATFSDLTLVRQLDRVMREQYRFRDMIGKGPEMQRIFDLVSVVARTDATVLIEGETGTGKDLLAKVIHNASTRADAPFVKVNCAALPDTLLESELFGVKKGAFTGADQDRGGRFQEADGGTIFLDEIGDLPLSLQAKLLRVLEDKEFYRLGGASTVKVDLRILSATNRDLGALVEKGLFREDLYYRLNVFRIELPPLRRRPEDMPLLIRHILRQLSAARAVCPPEISAGAMDILLNHRYPGNVRELENILEYALIICPDRTIEPTHLPAWLQRDLPPLPGRAEGPRPDDARRNMERERILSALRENEWHRTRTAEALGVDRTTLWRRMRRLGIGNDCPG
ncbi:MAG: sigma 54-interacting transcriptional regulator [Desulfatibacillaceae bacterium]